MHTKSAFLLTATLLVQPALAQAQEKAVSPFSAAPAAPSAAASTAAAADTPKAQQPLTIAPAASAPVAPATAPGASGTPAGGVSPAATTSQVQKTPEALLTQAPTIAALSALQKATLQADARKKAAELFGVPEAASAPSTAIVKRIDPYGASAPKPLPALLRVSAILGKAGSESVEIRDAAGSVAVYSTGMTIGDWRLAEIRHDAVLLRRDQEQSKADSARPRPKAKSAKPAGAATRLVLLGNEFPATAN